MVQEIDLGLVITLFFLGIVAAATMVIPGVSGSLILLAFGYYSYIVALVKDFLKAIIFFDKATLASNVFPILALAAGILIGVMLLAKLVEKLLKKRPKQVYSVILGWFAQAHSQSFTNSSTRVIRKPPPTARHCRGIWF